MPGKNASSGSISRLGPQFADRRSRIARAGLPNAPNFRNSNRECFRLETAVTRTKQTLHISSNREVEAYFSASRKCQKSFRTDPGPDNPPSFRRQTGEQNSNRECFRLETTVTQTKQRIGMRSNREIEACFSATPSTATLDGEVKEMPRPRWDSRGDANLRRRGRSKPSAPTKAKAKTELGKTKSRPPAFVAIRKNYVIDFIRLKENFNLTM